MTHRGLASLMQTNAHLTPARASRATRRVNTESDRVAALRYRSGGDTVEFSFQRSTRTPGHRRPTGTVSPSLANDLMLGIELGR